MPELRVLGLRASEPPVISPLPPNVPNAPLPKTAQVIFAPRETKEYVIKVDYQPRTDIGKALGEVAEKVRRRGLLVVVSDLLDDPERVLAGLRRLRSRRH